ncbi:MAG TPA: cytidine deaminase [Bacteroidales bacterium]|nr:cytidine deaminase [Bacteroidales bacterium]HPK29442.1 cytidine deaminase [Bacteroidales bacterium]
MTERQLNIKYLEYSSAVKMSSEDRELLESAISAAEGAYAKYSSFRVGAAVRMSNGVVVIGSNQENAAYPSGLCAERTALFYASARYPGESVEAIAVVALDDKGVLTELTYPCGACRQVMAEYEMRAGREMRIIVGSAGVVQVFTGVRSLMPFIFDNLA